jgi:DNA-binding NarL/FixJ family response regulator
MSSGMKQTQKFEFEFRRSKVLELYSKGHTERDIGNKLQISHVTVHRDLMYIQKQS